MSTKKTAKDIDVKDPEVGVYYNVPDSIYFEINAINNSLLKTLKQKTPAHFKYKKDNDDFDFSSSKDLGTICHVQLLQPERLEEDVKLIPDHNKNSHDFKYAMQDMFPEAGISKNDNWGVIRELVDEHYPDVVLTDQSTLDQAKRMVDQLYYDDRKFGDGRLEKVMSEADTEVVMIWEDEDTGLLLKCKFDILAEEFAIGADYKTTNDASPETFKYKVSDYGYARALEFYDQGAEANGIELLNNTLLVQETSAPYPHYWAPLEAREREVARAEIKVYLQQLKRCIEEDYWPAWRDSMNRNIKPLKLKYSDYQNDDLFFELSDDLPFGDDENETTKQ